MQLSSALPPPTTPTLLAKNSPVAAGRDTLVVEHAMELNNTPPPSTSPSPVASPASTPILEAFHQGARACYLTERISNASWLNKRVSESRLDDEVNHSAKQRAGDRPPPDALPPEALRAERDAVVKTEFIFAWLVAYFRGLSEQDAGRPSWSPPSPLLLDWFWSDKQPLDPPCCPEADLPVVIAAREILLSEGVRPKLAKSTRTHKWAAQAMMLLHEAVEVNFKMQGHPFNIGHALGFLEHLWPASSVTMTAESDARQNVDHASHFPRSTASAAPSASSASGYAVRPALSCPLEATLLFGIAHSVAGPLWLGGRGVVRTSARCQL
jgi:hypothetical protein